MIISNPSPDHGALGGVGVADHHANVPGLVTALDDILAASESGVLVRKAAITQAIAEAGTATAIGGWTALRVKQAIEALGLKDPVTLAQILTVNANIQFPATQVASAGANVLDDYQEADWTPVLKFNGGTTGIAYATQLGKLTKIGRVVLFVVSIVLTNKGSSTGSATIDGMVPLPAGTEPLSGGGGRFNGISYADNITWNTSGEGFQLKETTAAGVVTDITNSDFGNGASMRFSGHYWI